MAEARVEDFKISDRIDQDALKRGIFRLKMNGKTVDVDITVAYRQLVADDDINLSAEMDVYRAEIAKPDDRAKAQGAMLELAYKAFDIVPYSQDRENGWTESEMEIVLFDFLHYCMTLQKKTEDMPTTSQSSAGSGSLPSSETTESSESDCGLIDDESKPEKVWGC